MSKTPLSICIIAKNEEKRLPDCLKSAEFADEIIVVDDESTDRTIEIAEAAGAKVFKRKMDIEGKHRNYAYSQAKNKWVLSLDADERITPELAKEIDAAITSETSEHTAYSIPIKTFIGDRWVQGAGYYPAPKLRIFQKDKFRYEDASVHPRVFLEGSCGNLSKDILHYSCPNFGVFLHKMNRETELEAKKWMIDGRKVRFLKIFRKVIDRFLKNYFIKKGYKYGFQGYLMSCFHSLYQLMSYARYWEMQQDAKSEQSKQTSDVSLQSKA